MSDISPEDELESFIMKFTPEIAELARTVLAKMRTLYTGALELVYDNYNALAIGFSQTEKTSDKVQKRSSPHRSQISFRYG